LLSSKSILINYDCVKTQERNEKINIKVKYLKYLNEPKTGILCPGKKLPCIPNKEKKIKSEIVQ